VSGRGIVGVGLCLCVLAGAFGAPALFIPGIALILLVPGTRLWVRCASWRARLQRSPQSLVVEEGQRLTLTLVVNRPWLLGRGGELAPLPGAEFAPPRVRPGRPLHVDVTARRRGAHVLGASQLRFRDPFAISERTVSSATTELLVLPRPERIPAAAIARLAGVPEAGTFQHESWGEVDGLRAAGPGTRAARIHWLSVARTGTLMERRLAPEPDASPMVVLDAREPADEQALDLAVRAATSLALAFARHGGCSLLLPGEHHPHRVDPQLRGWRQLHARLALVAPGTLAWTQAARASLVVLVSAAARPRLVGSGKTPAGYLATPFPSSERRVLFEVAGCAVQPLARNLARAA
jgi:uncharacterized protein (DUF58 family)